MLKKETAGACYPGWTPTMSGYMQNRRYVKMFKFVPLREQLREAQKQNIVLEQDARQTRADLDFVAIMCDIEIPEDEDQEGAE